MPMRMASWLHRLVLAAGLLTAYLYAWTPARTAWVTYGAAPALEQVVEHTGREGTITARPASHRLHVDPSEGGTLGYTAPAGVKFLLPALFLVLIAPTRPRLWSFFAGHLGLGLLTVGFLAGGLAGLPGGLRMADFVQTYGVDAYSLAVPVLVFVRTRSASIA